MAPRPERTAATTQVSRDRRRIGMPSSAARSCESAAARTATPTSERTRNHHRPTAADDRRDDRDEVVGAEHERPDPLVER